MLSSHFIGEITEQQVVLEFLKRGIMLSKPLVQSSKYDFIADINDNLYKIQVKTCKLDEENQAFISFATSTSHTNTKGTLNLSYSAKEVDYFATIYDNQCYLVPYSKCGKRQQNLRLKPTLNGQVTGVLFAKDYEIDKIINAILKD